MSKFNVYSGDLVLIGGANGVKAAEVKGVTETQIKIGWRYYDASTGVSVPTEGVAQTYIIPDNGGLSRADLGRLWDVQEAAKAFVADIPLNMYLAEVNEAADFSRARGDAWRLFLNSASGVVGISRNDFGNMTVVVRTREAKVQVLGPDGKFVLGNGWEVFVKVTDKVNEDSATATVVHGDWWAAAGLAAKEVFATIPW